MKKTTLKYKASYTSTLALLLAKQKILLAWGENTSLDFDKATGGYLEDEVPGPVKSGCALL